MTDSTLHIALLCPGPSLAAFPGKLSGAYDLVLGVNRAAAAHACDWWVCCDADAFPRCTPLDRVDGQRPTIVCPQDQRRLMVRRYPASAEYPWRCSHSAWRRWPVKTWPPKNRIAWHRFSSTVALGLALQLVQSRGSPAAEIDGYGVDWLGEADWDGRTDPAFRRGEDRWSEERRLWALITDDLAERNIQVRRVPQESATDAGAREEAE